MKHHFYNPKDGTQKSDYDPKTGRMRVLCFRCGKWCDVMREHNSECVTEEDLQPGESLLKIICFFTGRVQSLLIGVLIMVVIFWSLRHFFGIDLLSFLK